MDETGRGRRMVATTYEATDADPIRMSLPARRALDLEHVVERVVNRVDRSESCDPFERG